MNDFMTNPYLHLGLGLLGANQGKGGRLGPAISEGLLTGMTNYSSFKKNADDRNKEEAMKQWFKDTPDMKPFMNAPEGIQNAMATKIFGGGDDSALIKQYTLARKQGFAGSFMDYQVALKKAGRTSINNYMGANSPGQKKADETFGEGVGNVTSATEELSNIAQLEEVQEKLGKQDNLSGFVVGNIPDFLNQAFNPDAINTREQVEQVVQGSLKQILDSQFSQKEVDQLLSRAYNPKLDESINKERVTRLLNKLKAAHNQKSLARDYFAKHKTLSGFKGKEYTIKDFMLEEHKDPNDAELERLMKKYGM